MMDLNHYKCVTCGEALVRRETKKAVVYACPNWKSGDCPGFLYNPSRPSWRVASETSIGVMYDISKRYGKYYCTCPAGGFQKTECKHKRWVRENYEDLPPTKEEKEESELEKVFYDLKEKGFFKEYKNYKDYKKGIL